MVEPELGVLPDVYILSVAERMYAEQQRGQARYVTSVESLDQSYQALVEMVTYEDDAVGIGVD